MKERFEHTDETSQTDRMAFVFGPDGGPSQPGQDKSLPKRPTPRTQPVLESTLSGTVAERKRSLTEKMRKLVAHCGGRLATQPSYLTLEKSFIQPFKVNGQPYFIIYSPANGNTQKSEWYHLYSGILTKDIDSMAENYRSSHSTEDAAVEAIEALAEPRRAQRARSVASKNP